MALHNPLSTDVFDLVTATLADPGANAQFSFPVDDNSRAKILAVRFRVTVANAGASRSCTLAGYDGTSRFAHSPAAALLPINATTFCYFALDIDPVDHIAALGYVTGTLSDSLYLNIGDTLVSRVLAMDADVQIRDIVIRYKRWITE